jgi:hypothetical protein
MQKLSYVSQTDTGYKSTVSILLAKQAIRALAELPTLAVASRFYLVIAWSTRWSCFALPAPIGTSSDVYVPAGDESSYVMRLP